MMTITLDYEYSRDEFLSPIKDRGIDCRQMINPVHRVEHYKDFLKKESFPNSTKISLQSIHLPSSLNLSVKDIERVYQQISFFLEI